MYVNLKVHACVAASAGKVWEGRCDVHACVIWEIPLGKFQPCMCALSGTTHTGKMMMLGLGLVILRKMGEVEGWWGVLKGDC